jgi:cytochrome c553
MRRQSKKTAQRERECKAFRMALVQQVGRCEICGHRPDATAPGYIRWRIFCHEIARGAHRQKALDKRFSILALCWRCHQEVHDDTGWPEARQLAVLKRSRPADFDLAAYNALIGRGPERITQGDVDAWEEKPGLTGRT